MFMKMAIMDAVSALGSKSCQNIEILITVEYTSVELDESYNNGHRLFFITFSYNIYLPMIYVALGCYEFGTFGGYHNFDDVILAST